MIRILLVDDHLICRRGVSLLINQCDEFSVVGETSFAREAIKMVSEDKADIVITEAYLPDLSGIEMMQLLNRANPLLPFVFFTASVDLDLSLAAIQAGGRGYVSKKDDIGELLQVISLVAAGGTMIPQWIMTKVYSEFVAPNPNPYSNKESLTQREMETLAQLASGQSNRSIARTLNVSENTVKTHVRSIFYKLGLNNRTEAAAYAMRQRIV